VDIEQAMKGWFTKRATEQVYYGARRHFAVTPRGKHRPNFRRIGEISLTLDNGSIVFFADVTCRICPKRVPMTTYLEWEWDEQGAKRRVSLRKIFREAEQEAAKQKLIDSKPVTSFADRKIARVIEIEP